MALLLPQGDTHWYLSRTRSVFLVNTSVHVKTLVHVLHAQEFGIHKYTKDDDIQFLSEWLIDSYRHDSTKLHLSSHMGTQHQQTQALKK